MAERLKATVSKTVILSNRDRGFESHPLRQSHFPESRAISKGKKAVSLVLAGFGHVGKASYALIQEKKQILRERYNIILSLKSILKSDGGYMAETDLLGCSLSELLADPASSQPFWRSGPTVESTLKNVEPGILAECTPSNLQTGEPGLHHIRTALENGWHVVTANKGPLVVAFKELRNLARDKHLSLRFSGATAAALPTLDIGLISLAGAEILSIEGILNGTSNFILTRMGEGVTFEEALRDAQARGIAEPNPFLDTEGWDTAAKLLLIANSVLGLELSLKDIKVKGITQIQRGLVEGVKREGRVIKLIGKFSLAESGWMAEVSPHVLETGHPLFHVGGTNKGITFLTDTMGSVTVTGGKSDPRGAAAALLKDIIHTFAPPPQITER